MDEKAAFSQRLNELCDDMQVPPKGQNRQTEVGKRFQVSQKGARKWLEGEGFPSIEKMLAIARWGGVRFEWLATGRGPKRLDGDPVRPALQSLLRAAEPLSDYGVQQLTKIVPALVEPPPTEPGSAAVEADARATRSQRRHRKR